MTEPINVEIGNENQIPKQEEFEFQPRESVHDRKPTQKPSKQIETKNQFNLLGGFSATERILGLDLRPPAIGILAPPPGNQDFLRHLSPLARRSIMRKMLNKQRERMRRLARFLRDQKDENEENLEFDRESFLEVISESVELEQTQIQRAANELDKAARMLDILDEILAMQDYTISRMGTFSQG